MKQIIAALQKKDRTKEVLKMWKDRRIIPNQTSFIGSWENQRDPGVSATNVVQWAVATPDMEPRTEEMPRRI